MEDDEGFINVKEAIKILSRELNLYEKSDKSISKEEFYANFLHEQAKRGNISLYGIPVKQKESIFSKIRNFFWNKDKADE